MKEILLKTKKLSKAFSNGGSMQHVLKNIDLELYKGDFTVIMGASGAGKSTMLNAIRFMGYRKEVMTIHGFRSMASTVLNELGYNRDWIERQLAHQERNSARNAYNYAQYLKQRQTMMQEWADYLSGLLEKARQLQPRR